MGVICHHQSSPTPILGAFPRLATGPRYNVQSLGPRGPTPGRAPLGSRFSHPQFKILIAKRGGPAENAFRPRFAAQTLSVAAERFLGSYRNAALAHVLRAERLPRMRAAHIFAAPALSGVAEESVESFQNVTLAHVRATERSPGRTFRSRFDKQLLE